jgi:hypothetical protein
VTLAREVIVTEASELLREDLMGMPCGADSGIEVPGASGCRPERRGLPPPVAARTSRNFPGIDIC